MSPSKVAVVLAIVIAWAIAVAIIFRHGRGGSVEPSVAADTLPQSILEISAPVSTDKPFSVRVSLKDRGTIGPVAVTVGQGRVLYESLKQVDDGSAVTFTVIPEPLPSRTNAQVTIAAAARDSHVSTVVGYQATRVIALLAFDLSKGPLGPKLELIPDGDRAAVVFFYGRATNKSMSTIRLATKRVVTFMDVDPLWQEWPAGFDPNTRSPLENFNGKCRYCYHRMCRFWFVRAWSLPIFDGVELVLRFDTDSRIEGQWKVNPFEVMENRGLDYMANVKNGWLFWEPGHVVVGLASLVERFVEENHITVANPVLWDGMLKEKQHCLYHFYNNFQLLRVSFMRRNDVNKWVKHVDQTHGIFLHRWGDSPLISFTVAMFLPPEKFAFRNETLMPYGHR